MKYFYACLSALVYSFVIESILSLNKKNLLVSHAQETLILNCSNQFQVSR